MPLSTTDSRFSYSGDAVTVAFSFPRKYVSSSDLKVIVTDEDDGSESLKTLNVDYTVTGAGLSNGVYATATVTFTTAPGTDKKVIIYRDPALTQEFDFTAETDAENALNRRFDLIEMQLQRLSDARSRSFRMSDGFYSTFDPLIPDVNASAGVAAGQALMLAAGKTALTWGTPAAGATISAAMIDLFTATTAPFAYVSPSGSDDTTAIQTQLTAGKLVLLSSGATYYISARLNITSAGSGLVGDGTPLIIMLAGSGKFDNSSASSGNRYGTNAVGVYASSIDRPICRGVRIKYETQTDDRYVKAIAFQTCTDILIEEVEAWNFTKALGVIYVGACTGGSVSRNYVHDCTTNSATTGQITGIEFDNDNTLSSGIDVDGNRIENLTVGASFLASWGYQTDGINVTKETSKQLRIRGNHIKGVGEGIDHFGVDCEIADNHVEDCYYYGIKHVNGSCRTLTTTNTIRRCGLAGIILAGSATINQDTADNYIFGNDIYDIDPNGTFSGNTTACILFAANSGTTYLPRRNHVCDNKLDCGTNGKYGVYAGASDGTLNFVLRNRVRNAATADYSIHATCVPYYYTEQAGNVAISGTLDIGGVTTQTLGVSAGRLQVEGVNLVSTTSTDTLTNKTLTTPIGVPYLLARGTTQLSLTGTTSQTTLATVTVPQGAMGPNGTIRIRSLWSAAANNANAKTARVRFDANTMSSGALASNLTYSDDRTLINRNSASSQLFLNTASAPFGVSTTALGTQATNTASAARDITFTGQLADGADTMSLEYYEVWLTYGA